MIVVLKPDATEADIAHIQQQVVHWGLQTHLSRGAQRTILGIIGPEDLLREKPLAAFPGVESVMPILKPYRLASFEFRQAGSVVTFAAPGGAVEIGGKRVTVIAGPCSVETREQILGIARSVKNSGASLLRGGAFKPRTSPYSFQGLGLEGLDLLAETRRETGLPVVTELIDTRDLAHIEKYADMIQIGARNMQNYSLLKEVGKSRKPVLLKRGMSATIKDFLMSAEYILSEGNFNVVLCERGIRTFETMTRNTLDLNAVPVLKRETHLPVIVDPSHGIGLRDFVSPMALAAVAAGADGVMIEVHNAPESALSDGEQSLRLQEFEALMSRLRGVAEAIGRSV